MLRKIHQKLHIFLHFESIKYICFENFGCFKEKKLYAYS